MLRRMVFLAVAASGLTACNLDTVNEFNNPDPKGKKESILRVADASHKAGDIAAAIDLYRQALPYAGKDTSVHLKLADLLLENRQDMEAEKMLRDYIKEYPMDTALLRKLGEVQVRRGLLDRALNAYNMGLQIDSQDPLLYSGKGVALDLAGKHTLARDVYDQGLAISPNHVSLNTNYAMSYILTKDYNKAIDLLTPIVNSPFSTTSARQNLALAYGLKGNLKQARELGLEDFGSDDVEDNLNFYRQMMKTYAKP